MNRVLLNALAVTNQLTGAPRAQARIWLAGAATTTPDLAGLTALILRNPPDDIRLESGTTIPARAELEPRQRDVLLGDTAPLRVAAGSGGPTMDLSAPTHTRRQHVRWGSAPSGT